MRVEWTDEFDLWLTRLEAKADTGDSYALRQLNYVAAELALLRNLQVAPSRDEETAQLKWVRQHGRHEVWRVSHRFDEEVAIRLIIWFPPGESTVVVTVFAGDKKRIGDVFSNSVGPRADAAVDRRLMRQEQEPQREDEKDGERDDEDH